MPRMARAVPYLGYVVVAARKPTGPNRLIGAPSVGDGAVSRLADATADGGATSGECTFGWSRPDPWAGGPHAASGAFRPSSTPRLPHLSGGPSATEQRRRSGKPFPSATRAAASCSTPLTTGSETVCAPRDRPARRPSRARVSRSHPPRTSGPPGWACSLAAGPGTGRGCG